MSTESYKQDSKTNADWLNEIIHIIFSFFSSHLSTSTLSAKKLFPTQSVSATLFKPLLVSGKHLRACPLFPPRPTSSLTSRTPVAPLDHSLYSHHRKTILGTHSLNSALHFTSTLYYHSTVFLLLNGVEKIFKIIKVQKEVRF